ncbi:Acyl-CoA N-acyltransferase [Penicillium angulare]|uniref:Acyl-CoA N-acyltransferase n=1 Tax=Penicillium angulare TaxID=116970 RepID=UPI002540400B|nr:Acyl-CoA N-acyltransferase [Penicillium angulare]KAJ5263230.1 Acyl-CoA N-acyltransferase [Penicillium angulare]
MAYQFFANSARSQQSQQASSPPPLHQSRSNNPPNRVPPLQPPAVAKTTSSNVSQNSFTPYPHDISSGYATPHPKISVETVKTAHIPSLTRITGVLLPIRYPNSFYTATITDPVIASLSRVAIYHEHHISGGIDPEASAGTDKVIGAIRCRLEKQDPTRVVRGKEATNLYIQTLHLLSPYRGSGVATSLLNSLLFEPSGNQKPTSVSGLVRHFNIRSVTAHVHEANEDALNWYIARGFKIQDGVVEGYYRRLKPSGARIVRLDVDWHDENSGEEDQPQLPPQVEASLQESPSDDADDEDWEKVEAEDEEEGDLGVQTLSDSRVLEKDETPSRKRKAEDAKGNNPQRR